MQFSKDQVLSLLRGQGDDVNALKAQDELPETVDTDTHASLLSKVGVDPADLLTKFGGGSVGPAAGIAGKIGL